MTARQTIGLLLLVTFLPNCYSWTTYEGEGPPISQELVRVHYEEGPQLFVPVGMAREDGEVRQEEPGVVTLRQPFVDGEDYVGERGWHGEWLQYIPLQAIDEFEVEDHGRGRTTLVSAAILVGLGALLYVGLSSIKLFDSGNP